jgi:hypothetical protein
MTAARVEPEGANGYEEVPPSCADCPRSFPTWDDLERHRHVAHPSGPPQRIDRLARVAGTDIPPLGPTRALQRLAVPASS